MRTKKKYTSLDIYKRRPSRRINLLYHPLTNIEHKQNNPLFLGGTLDITQKPYSTIIETNIAISQNMNTPAILIDYNENNFAEVDSIINKQFKDHVTTYEWTNKCSRSIFNSCGNILTKAINNEIKSTIYMLRVIYKSLLKTSNTIETSNNIFIITDNNKSKLTGNWENDKQYIDLNIRQNNPRLIMGFGPSASGKTYNSKIIVEILSQLETDFPNIFLSIDGGIAREQSMTYQYIVNEIHKKGYAGLTGLVSEISSQGIFSSSKIKKQLIRYLNDQKMKGNRISLYVPETLGFCLFNTCQPKYEEYIKYTEDKEWIALNIWQHRNHKECEEDSNYPEIYKCRGCEESGKEREKEEGKKYSSRQWKSSYENGQQEMIKAIGGCYEIHNTGNLSGHINTFIDHTNYLVNPKKKEIIKSLIIEKGWRYQEKTTNKEVDNKADFEILLKHILNTLFDVK
jgi:hypothetical protein